MVRRTLDTSRGPSSYLEAGAGWPVVLIHAFPLSAEMWQPQLERVPQGWRFIAPDLRGFGHAQAPAGQAGLDVFAKDVEALLDALEIETAVIGGLSLGGYVSFALHRLAPERFTSIVLADTKAEADTPDGRAARQKMSELVRSKGAAAVADSMLPKLLSAAAQKDAALAGRVRAMIEANTMEGIDAAIHAMMDRPDSAPTLARLSMPALILVGEEDVVTPPADSERMQQALTRSQLVVIPGAAHLSNLEAPDQFSTALASFLTSSL